MELLNPESLPPGLQNAATSYYFTAGQRLFRQGDRASNVYLVTSGRVKLVRYTIEGRMVVLQVVRSGESLGDSSFFADFYSCSAIAEVGSIAIAYPQPLLEAALQKYPELARGYRTKLISKIQSFELSLELLQIRSAHLRLFQYLQYNASPSNETVVNLDRPLQEVAAELDLAPRTISRALARLEEEGRIVRQAGAIILQI